MSEVPNWVDESFQVVGPAKRSFAMRVLLICEHGGSDVPRQLGDLGLGPDVFRSVPKGDPGVAALTTRLATELPARGVVFRVSRLVVDPNQEEGKAIPLNTSNLVEIHTNRRLSEPDKERRGKAWRRFHDAVAAELRDYVGQPRRPICGIISIHSNDRTKDEIVIPTEDKSRLSALLRHKLDLPAGRGFPATEGRFYALWHHIREKESLAYARIEVPASIITSKDEIDRIAQKLVPAIQSTVEQISKTKKLRIGWRWFDSLPGDARTAICALIVLIAGTTINKVLSPLLPKESAGSSARSPDVTSTNHGRTDQSVDHKSIASSWQSVAPANPRPPQQSQTTRSDDVSRMVASVNGMQGQDRYDALLPAVDKLDSKVRLSIRDVLAMLSSGDSDYVRSEAIRRLLPRVDAPVSPEDTIRLLGRLTGMDRLNVIDNLPSCMIQPSIAEEQTILHSLDGVERVRGQSALDARTKCSAFPPG